MTTYVVRTPVNERRFTADTYVYLRDGYLRIVKHKVNIATFAPGGWLYIREED